MAAHITRAEVEALRTFNRFYTRQIGLLDEHLLDSAYTLTQARVLFELGSGGATTATEIREGLGLDRGYASRIIDQFVTQGLVRKQKCEQDGRRTLLSLTAAGKRVFDTLDGQSQAAIGELLGRLITPRRQALVRSVERVRRLLGAGKPAARVRRHRIGDIGWAIELHARLYADEYGWNEEFEALVAKLFADFASDHDPRRECCWIAEADGERAGCVFVVENADDRDAAQLRCLLVDPAWRGLGLGEGLVDTCIGFAEEAGYRRMILWTNDVLSSARRIYEAKGFELIGEDRHRSFGHDLVGQTWERPL